jgi:hypothetical protein
VHSNCRIIAQACIPCHSTDSYAVFRPPLEVSPGAFSSSLDWFPFDSILEAYCLIVYFIFNALLFEQGNFVFGFCMRMMSM